MMFRKILIANRGEIALRVLRACREMGIRSVVVYSEADRDSLPVRLADESYCIGPAAPARSYLNMASIVGVARLCGADAIHPGYGFLSENAAFAEMCAEAGIVFIGPPPEVLRNTGDKARAREAMIRAGVPVVPGTPGTVGNPEEAARLAAEIGYPVMVKAACGGGGRGMRVAHGEADLMRALRAAGAEAEYAFGSGAVYLEKYLEEPRHVEVQILADNHGSMIHLGERDCSIQRRNQKLLEEAPSVAVTPELRQRLGETALAAARAVGYRNAGTVEFLLDKQRNFYFIEINARIQVEHPVTELVTGIDLVKEQIRLAAGEPLGRRQEDVELRGWAIECRINAEDPARNFLPCPGQITNYLPPGGPGIRVDSALYAGYQVLPYYDSLLGKVAVWGATREEAISRMQRALQEYIIEGVATTIPFHLRVIENAFFRRGEVYTNFIQRRILAQPELALR